MIMILIIAIMIIIIIIMIIIIIIIVIVINIFSLTNVVFRGEGKTGVPGERPFGAEKRTNNKLNPHKTPGAGTEPGNHWWEASALTTGPSLLSKQ